MNKEDPRCISVKPYPCLNCSATYLACGGDCKPIIRKSATKLLGRKRKLNCCTYCIKTKSCEKVENDYLMSTRYNKPQYLKTGNDCVGSTEKGYLKEEQRKREALKKACDEQKKLIQAQKELVKKEYEEKKIKEKIRKNYKIITKETEKKKRKQIKNKKDNNGKKIKNDKNDNKEVIYKKEKDTIKVIKGKYKIKKVFKKLQEQKQAVINIRNRTKKVIHDKITKKKRKNLKKNSIAKQKIKKNVMKEPDETKVLQCSCNVTAKKGIIAFLIKNIQIAKGKHVCNSGICADAAINNDDYICKCKKIRFFEPQCTNKTCVGVIPPPVDGTMNKMSCVCKNVSMKLLGNRLVCEGGQCQRARNSNRDDFVCKCQPKVTCDRNTCAKKHKFKELAQSVHKENEGKCKCGLQWKKIELQDQIDQAGEPAFVVQIRRGGHEIANLEEVQENVKNLGKSRIPCTCSAFNKHLQHTIKNVCPTGTCRNALNKKSISINCNCMSRFCTEETCHLKAPKVLARSSRIADPLFSLNIDTDKNSILNPGDFRQRIAYYRNKFCKTGRCRDSYNKGEMDFTCQCPYIPSICTDKTCNQCVCVKNVHTQKRPAEKNELKKNKNKRERKAQKQEKKRINGKNNSRPKQHAMQGVSVTVGAKKEFDGPCDCGAGNCKCQRHSGLACKAHFCCIKGKRTTSNSARNAYCCDTCEKSNQTDQTESNTKSQSKQRKIKDKLKKGPKKEIIVGKEVPTRQTKGIKNVKKEAKLKSLCYCRNKHPVTVAELQKWENEEKRRIEQDTVEGDYSLTSSCLSGLASWIIVILRELASVLYTCVRHPKQSFAYAKQKVMNPKLTFDEIKRWGNLVYRSKLLRIKNNIARSETATMLFDEILTSKYVKLFLPKNKATHNDLVMRQNRKMKRKELAMYSCKHIFLLTRRKTPCMWFFYLCPTFYPQLLDCLGVFNRLCEVFMAIGAIIVWTPCFIAFEVIRLCFCCTMCTA